MLERPAWDMSSRSPNHSRCRISDASITSSPRPSNEAWERRSCGEGPKGPRVHHWAALQITSIEDFDGEMPTHQRWALARRSTGEPEGNAYYLA